MFQPFDQEELVERCAYAAHEVNRVYARAIGEKAQKPWHGVSPEQVKSVRSGVRLVFAGKQPDELHAAWLEMKKAAGWTYGPEKDEEKKTHPCLLPYSQLPSRQRVKDKLFRDVVLAMHNALIRVGD